MECMRSKFQDGVVLDGRFQTISPLNHGSFGMVFIAKDLQTNELVALKCLTKRSATSQSEPTFAIDDKSEELECHSQLGSHPNIVNLIHSFETEAHVYLVLEYCSNGDLYEAIRTGCGPLETEHVRAFMLQLVDAVEYIHSKGIYHRDIKPENIFLSSTGAMKLGDFGLVTREKWSYETTVGSDRYMAPEQYDSADAGYCPAQADIWAIGICLLNILFSRNPFTTPTEADPLYLDFVRDRQSLFDIFPTMSQDTFEVIVQCMSLDPTKRSLAGARDALMRVLSFTTDDESLDDFCTIPKTTTVSANREPLRTPSIQSPQIDQGGSFPWAKALQASPPQRQLSAIPDSGELYEEDLFASDDSISQDWFSVKNTPSLASVLDSHLGESVRVMNFRRPSKVSGPPRAEKAAVSGSLPISMTKSKPMAMPSLSSVFGRKRDLVSKSWSDMWDEEIEEEEEEELEHERELKQRQEQNARTWSQDSKNDATPRVGLSEPKNSSFINIQSSGSKNRATAVVKDIDNDPIDDFFYQDNTAMTRQYSPPRYSPPSKRSTLDKWAALGDKRRAVKSPGSESTDVLGARKDTANNGKGLGFFGFGMGGGFWDKDDKVNRKVKEWGKARNNQCRPQAQRGIGDLEWVGGVPWHRQDMRNLHM